MQYAVLPQDPIKSQRTGPLTPINWEKQCAQCWVYDWDHVKELPVELRNTKMCAAVCVRVRAFVPKNRRVCRREAVHRDQLGCSLISPIHEGWGVVRARSDFLPSNAALQLYTCTCAHTHRHGANALFTMTQCYFKPCKLIKPTLCGIFCLWLLVKLVCVLFLHLFGLFSLTSSIFSISHLN